MSAIRSTHPLGFPWKTQDPFIFCVHHEDFYPEGNEVMGPKASLAGRRLGEDFEENKDGWRMYHGQKVPGFPAHPHCGFETVTITTRGVIDHSDSLGAAGRFGYGDVQWMTAGAGVQHCEMFPLVHPDKKNPLELFQIWLNLPRTKKKAVPHFAMLWADTIPSHRENGTIVKIIAGKLNNTVAPDPAPDSWAANSGNEVAIWLIEMQPGSSWNLPPASAGVNRSLYFFEGQSVKVDGQTFEKHQAFELTADAPLTVVNGPKASRLLLLQGKPISEPVVQYGPFVGNSREDIQRAYSDFQETQFGGWPWPSTDHVHPREKSRFALYPDGREETKS